MLAAKNPHPRDTRIQFIDSPITLPNGRTVEQHHFIIDGQEYRNCSVSSLLKDYFPYNFDAVKASGGDVELQRKWEIENHETVVFGKWHHLHFENYFNEVPFQFDPHYPNVHCYEDVPGWAHFQAFLASLPDYLEPYRTEWVIFSTEAKLPGIIDLVLRDMRFPDKLVLVVVDYKIKKDPTKLPWCQCGNRNAQTASAHDERCPAVGAKPASRNILRRKCDVDSAQVCLYSRVLDDLYGATVSERIVAYLHPNYPMYIHYAKAEDYEALVEDMIKGRTMQ